MARTTISKRAPKMVKSRYFPRLDEAEAFAESIEQKGGIAWVGEEWGPDMGNPHTFWGYRTTWISWASLSGHVSKVEREREHALRARADHAYRIVQSKVVARDGERDDYLLVCDSCEFIGPTATTARSAERQGKHLHPEASRKLAT